MPWLKWSIIYGLWFDVCWYYVGLSCYVCGFFGYVVYCTGFGVHKMSEVHVSKDSTKLCTARVLRDFPKLRSIDKRREMTQKVQEVYGFHHNPVTVDRMARHLQNKMGLYLPQQPDDRYDQESEWRRYFAHG